MQICASIPVPEACRSKGDRQFDEKVASYLQRRRLQKNLHEIDDDRTGAKALATAGSDVLALPNRFVTSALGLPMSMCKLRDLTYVTLEYEKGACDLLMRAFGTKEPDFVHGLIHQIASAGSKGQYPDESGMKFMFAAFKGIEPRDQIDAMLSGSNGCVYTSLPCASQIALATCKTLQEQDSAERTFNKRPAHMPPKWKRCSVTDLIEKTGSSSSKM